MTKHTYEVGDRVRVRDTPEARNAMINYGIESDTIDEMIKCPLKVLSVGKESSLVDVGGLGTRYVQHCCIEPADAPAASVAEPKRYEITIWCDDKAPLVTLKNATAFQMHKLIDLLCEVP